jgi:cytochrome b
MSSLGEVKVWDSAVRIFHWSLATAFFVAYFTEDDLLGPHVWAGYLVLGLVVFRVLWGFVGSAHARFSDFVNSPRSVLNYLRSLRAGQAKRYLGHNPAGGAMIIALLVSLAVVCVSGVALYGLEPGAGPLVGLMHGLGHDAEDVLEEVHEVAAQLTLLLVVIHVAGVIAESLRERENLIRAMVTGRKRV